MIGAIEWTASSPAFKVFIGLQHLHIQPVTRIHKITLYVPLLAGLSLTPGYLRVPAAVCQV